MSSDPVGNLCSLLKSVGPGLLLGFQLDLGLFSPEGPDQGTSQAALVLGPKHEQSEYSNVGVRKSQV